MYFHNVIGQDDLKARLTDTARRGIIPHARLFCGRTGSGTFPLALAYARYLNCSDRTDTDACGKCHSCRQYDALAHPDLHFVFPIVADKKRKRTVCDDYLGEWREMLTEHTYFDLDEWLDRMETAGKQALIYAEESDQMIRKTSLRIYEAQYRVLIVWMPERMHAACANKLLKLIEEPPAHTVILMVSDAPDLILGTILSRTQRLDVRPIEADALAHASYTPVMDGDADPGEVVWTWVPYQEDASVGKDRPVVVIGADGPGVYVVQLTSKDHGLDAEQEARNGRFWLDIGSGAWDPKGRPSQVRLDRALWVLSTDVRREGAVLPRATWQRVVDAIDRHHRAH